jgi:hypothetical protein
VSYAADDTQVIARRLKEIEAEQQIARTGTSAPAEQEKAEDLPMGYGDYLTGYAVGRDVGEYKVLGGNLYMRSLAHPQWPYAGTGFEWRKFVRS